jgi:CubicO group peptidase (beta-lactamase class C family)
MGTGKNGLRSIAHMRRAVFALLFLTVFVLLAAQTLTAQTASTPAGDWQTAKPESLGFSSQRLEALRQWLKAGPTSSMMIVVKGKVIFSYGDVTHPSKIASIRKSVLAMLMGPYVINGKLDMNKTVVQLGLQDKTPFLPSEQHATLEQLMTCRSGIYLPNDSPVSDGSEPQRGSIPPGAAFYYNNWEFDASGTAFEKVTGKNIYDALATDLAQPLGMQDFHRELQQKVFSPDSVHPEYAMFLSARDMARLGLLMEQYGKWNGKQLLDWNWVSYMTSIVTPWDEMNPSILRLRGAPERWGFGLGWWVWDAKYWPGGIYGSPFQGAYQADGSGGQYITVLPSREMVIVHKVDLETHKMAEWMTPEEWDTITNMVIAAQCSATCPAR